MVHKQSAKCPDVLGNVQKLEAPVPVLGHANIFTSDSFCLIQQKHQMTLEVLCCTADL